MIYGCSQPRELWYMYVHVVWVSWVVLGGVPDRLCIFPAEES